MTEALLVGILIAAVALGLILSGRSNEQVRRRYKQLAEQNLALRQLVRSIENEAKAQRDAGDLNFEHTLSLIADHREKESTP